MAISLKLLMEDQLGFGESIPWREAGELRETQGLWRAWCFVSGACIFSLPVFLVWFWVCYPFPLLCQLPSFSVSFIL